MKRVIICLNLLLFLSMSLTSCQPETQIDQKDQFATPQKHLSELFLDTNCSNYCLQAIVLGENIPVQFIVSDNVLKEQDVRRYDPIEGVALETYEWIDGQNQFRVRMGIEQEVVIYLSISPTGNIRVTPRDGGGFFDFQLESIASSEDRFKIGNLLAILGEPDYYGIITHKAFSGIDVLLFYEEGIILRYTIHYEEAEEAIQQIDVQAFGSVTMLNPMEMEHVMNQEIVIFHLFLNQYTQMFISPWEGFIDLSIIN